MVEYDKVTAIDEAIFCGHLEPDCPNETADMSGRSCADPNCANVQILEPDGQFSPRQGYKDRVRTGCDDMCCFGVGFRCLSQEGLPVYWGETGRSHDSFPGITSDDLCATIDTGCQRMAIGLTTLQKLDQALPNGLQTRLVRQEHKF